MDAHRISIDLSPDERARLEAEGRRRGIGADAVIIEFVRGLPEPDTNAQMQTALAGLRELWSGAPHISEADFDTALAASREELESRTFLT